MAMITDVDRRQAEQRRRLRDNAAGERRTADAPQAAVEQARRKTDPQARDKARRRFATFNTFVDAVGRYLHPSDRDVWHVLFRFADGQTNVAEVRLADIAARLNCHTRTAKRSVDRLIAANLVERLKRGTRQGGPSRYRINPEPARMVEALRAAWEAGGPASSARKARPAPRTRRSQSGRFTR